MVYVLMLRPWIKDGDKMGQMDNAPAISKLTKRTD